MLIESKVNFKLPIIGFLLILRWGEKLHDVILGKQGTAQDSHDLHDGAAKFEFVLDDSDETVGATVTFYSSDTSKQYLVTIEGVAADGTIICRQAVIK